jgi:hypothetical protein
MSSVDETHVSRKSIHRLRIFLQLPIQRLLSPTTWTTSATIVTAACRAWAGIPALSGHAALSIGWSITSRSPCPLLDPIPLTYRSISSVALKITASGLIFGMGFQTPPALGQHLIGLIHLVATNSLSILVRYLLCSFGGFTLNVR